MSRTPIALHIFHWLFVLFMVAPLAVVVLVSFTDKGYISFPFDGASLRWFQAIWNQKSFIDSFWLSLALGATAATLAVVLAVPAAMAIAWHRFPARDLALALLMSPLMLPAIVLGIAILRLLSHLGMTGSLAGLVAAHMVVVLPYVLRLVIAAAAGYDHALSQAARSLGASAWAAFRRIELPQLVPGIAGGWIIAFVTSFDELTMSIFVSSAGTTTLPVRMYNYIANTIDPLLAAISTVLIALTLVLMIVLDRLFGLDRILGGKA
ncbi:MAG: ABC transporter permease [Devosia sp. 67-54]|uniref:ABC transporter permease n=1 Tax=unclassified Devosia TaxID=196773 RepID=UPI00095BFB06|nr:MULTISPECIES: ABC transporter permease [unclassified Devosia]MBN9306986.1 ABC transporter permease [Devosia sp.]OJX16927.1 MAG: ABC transporter permease [Devosia sp. 67-54]